MRGERPAQAEVFEVDGIRLSLLVPSSVYLPSDDTRMLTKAALTHIKPGVGKGALRVLEVGCGSGAVSLALAKARGEKCQIVASDISTDAIQTAKANAKKNGLVAGQTDRPSAPAAIRFVLSDLFSALPASAKFDWILFNPPYLPTAKLDKVSGPLNVALDGGADGLAVVKTFLEEVGGHLAADGRILLIVSSLQPQQKLQTMLRRNGITGLILAEESFFFEKLQVWMLHQA